MNNLKLQKINKHYGKKKQALYDFTFEFTNGIYGLLGPNGAGKSTLMNIITDNLLPDKDGGKILWNNEETKTLKDKFRSRLGFMPQQQNLYESMTARSFLNYVSALKCLDKKTAVNEIEEIIERVELTESIDKKMGGFSGGMKQRVIIRNILSNLGEEKIIIVSTHIVSDIETIAKEILFIKEGHLIDSGTIPELIEKVEIPEKSLENLYMQYYGEIQK